MDDQSIIVILQSFVLTETRYVAFLLHRLLNPRLLEWIVETPHIRPPQEPDASRHRKAT